MSLATIHLRPRDQREAALDGPALAPPPGVVPNFEHPPNSNVVAQVLIPVLLTLVTLALLLRSYAKFVVLKSLSVDDVLIIVGYGTYIVYLYDVYHVVNNVGLFVHQWNATVREVSDTQHILQFGATFYTITLAVVKAAILLQWIRIFAPNGTRGVFFWCCQILLWTNVLFYLAADVAGNLICVPFERIWDKTVPGVCYNGRPLNLAIGIFNFISDVLILFLPQKLIWSLNMSMKRKIGIAVTFATGLVAIGAAGFRLGVTVGYVSDPDWLYKVSGLSIGCITEMSAILLVYCLPGVPRAFRDTTILKKLSSSLRSILPSTARTASHTAPAKSSADFHSPSDVERVGSKESHDVYQVSADQPRGLEYHQSDSTEHLRDKRNAVP